MTSKLSVEDVKRLIEEGRKRSDELRKRIAPMKVPSPEHLHAKGCSCGKVGLRKTTKTD